MRGIVLCGGFSYGDVLGAGQGWARSILLVFSLIGFLGLLASKWGSLEELSFYGTALLAINLLVQAAALWLLYAGSGGEWFRLRKDPS